MHVKATNLQRQWQYIAESLGLSIKTDFSISLPNGAVLIAEVLLEGYGAPKGMLLMSDLPNIKSIHSYIQEQGFGFSCLSQPPASEIHSLDGVDEMLEDWGKYPDQYA